MPSIESIWRYPIKGLTSERLNTVTLTPGRCLPHDRRFALARADTEFDPALGHKLNALVSKPQLCAVVTLSRRG
jgi:uncharacterized protein YcbX